MSEVIEWAPFKLREGVSEKALMDAAHSVERDFLRGQTGFVSRRLLRAADGGYVDMVVWSNHAHAAAAMAKAANSAACGAYFSLMGADHAAPGAGVAHYELLSLDQ